MESNTGYEEDKRKEIKLKLRQYFDGKIVRKNLTKKIKEDVYKRQDPEPFKSAFSDAGRDHKDPEPDCTMDQYLFSRI